MEKKHKSRRTGLSRLITALGGAVALAYLVAFPLEGFTATDPLSIKCSKHDFNCLNQRAGVSAMAGLAYSDYGDPCIYCHIPAHAANGDPAGVASVDTEALGGIPGWNRYKPSVSGYRVYGETGGGDQFYQTNSAWNFDSKVRSISPISLLCLSCHDGTMGVDQTVFKPKAWLPEEDFSLHMRMNTDGDLRSCGRCHNGKVAHDIGGKVLGQDLTNDHPISIMYLGLVQPDIDPDFWPPDMGMAGFSAGVKLYNGFIECATCHDVHDPSNDLLLRVNRERICLTCHDK